MTGNRIFGASICLIALAYVASATQIQLGFLSDPVGSRTFPYIVGGVAFICAAYIFLKPDPEPAWPSLSTFGRIGVALLVMYLFSLALKPIGFLIPAAIASAALSYLIEPRPVAAIVTGVGLSIGLFFVFNLALGLGLAPFGRAFVN